MADASDENDNGPTHAVRAELEHLLERKFPQRKYHYTLAKATAKGENYVSIVYRVKLEFLDVTACDKEYSLILKVPPQNEARRKQFAARACFLKETQAFLEFLPAIKAFQARKKAASTKFDEYPECLLCMTEDLNEAIFLEDLSLTGYRLFDRFAVMDMPHIRLVMQAYAKFHACSLAMKAQQPLEFRKFQNIEDFFVQRKDDVALNDYLEQLKGSALNALDPAKDQKQIARLQTFFARGTFSELLQQMLDSATCEPYAVVCHGDCWTNNILFKYENDRVVDLRIIDWQILRYSTPISDLMYFIFACTTKALRDKHFQEIMDCYYEQLAQHIERLGSSASELLPRSAFDHQLKRRGAVGLLFATIVLPVVTLKEGDVPDLEHLSERIEAGETTDLQAAGFLSSSNEAEFKKRMREVIIDCVNYGFI